MRTPASSFPSRVDRPGARARIAAPLVLGLACAAGAVVAGASPAAATAPSWQQWETSVSAVSGSGVGSSQTFTFGTTGVTAVHTITSLSGAGCSLAGVGGDLLGDNVHAVDFISPTPPASTPYEGRTCSSGGAVSTLTFSRPVLHPLIHVINLDNSSLGVAGTSTSGAAEHLTLLSHNNELDLSGDVLNFARLGGAHGGCDPLDGSWLRGACGSAEINAASGAVSALTLTASTLGGDGYAVALSFPTASLAPSFSPTTLPAGDTGTLTYTIDNVDGTAQPDFTGLGFTESALPAGLTIGSGTPTSTHCGSPVFKDAGGHSLGSGDVGVRVTGIAAVRDTPCLLHLPVTAAATGTYTVNGGAATPAVANLIPSGSAALTVTAAVARPGLGVTTKASSARITAVGQHLSFSFRVRNTGNVALRRVRVHVLAFTGGGSLGSVSCPGSRLAVGASMTCRASYRTTATDLAAGGVSLTAVAEAGDSVTPTTVASTASALKLGSVKATIGAGLPGDGDGRRTPLVTLGVVLLVGAAAPLLLARRRLRRTSPDGVRPATEAGSLPA